MRRDQKELTIPQGKVRSEAVPLCKGCHRHPIGPRDREGRLTRLYLMPYRLIARRQAGRAICTVYCRPRNGRDIHASVAQDRAGARFAHTSWQRDYRALPKHHPLRERVIACQLARREADPGRDCVDRIALLGDRDCEVRCASDSARDR